MAKKQQTIEGVFIDEIDHAAENYRAIRDRRMGLTEEEVEASGVLIDVMKEHKLKTYKTPHGQLVTVVNEPGKTKVKVKNVEVDGKGIDE